MARLIELYEIARARRTGTPAVLQPHTSKERSEASVPVQDPTR
jgi:hypothetical protein